MFKDRINVNVASTYFTHLCSTFGYAHSLACVPALLVTGWYASALHAHALHAQASHIHASVVLLGHV